MGLAFKHMAVRLWVSLLLGSFIALTLMPPLAAAVGPGLMTGPGLLMVAAAYWLTGIVFASLGRKRIQRLVGEATVWQRAGMAREARQALERAENTLYSYYFSPFSRKAPATALLAQLARFQLSQSQPDASSDAIVSTYLRHFPSDRDAAAKWLEGVLAGRPVTRQTHDIAAAIGQAHADDMALQQMLAQFYLAEGCCDFAALNTYRQLVARQEPPPDGLLRDMIELFMSHQRADVLALQAYLRGCQRGHADPRLREAIAACRLLVHPTPITRPFLEKAEAILIDVDASAQKAMASRFLPEMSLGDERSPSGSRRTARPSFAQRLHRLRSGVNDAVRPVAALGIGRRLSAARRRATGMLASRQAAMTIKWAVLGLFGVAVGWLAVSTTLHLSEDFKPVETAPDPVAVPVDDPYTLQVAAYLKADDARRYVGELKKKGLDAYWTRASGNDKTWYQVRVSHFSTKAEARAMGERLKAGQLINDYYVANYRRPDG